MTLSRIMAWRIAGITLSFGLLGAASVWGLLGMRGDLRRAHDEYLELRLIRDVSLHATEVKASLHARESNTAQVLLSLDAALASLDHFVATERSEPHVNPAVPTQGMKVADQARARLSEVRVFLSSGPVVASDREWTHQVAGVDQALHALGGLADEMDDMIAAAQEASGDTLRETLVLMGALFAGGIVLIVALNLSQYRAVIRPLRALREGVRRVAGGNLKERLEIRGADEFSELAGDFNHMARELATLYSDLERKVLAKSRELVRTERLASVGFLAAGVAHEINNPLNIITGHAELSLRQAERLAEGKPAGEIREALQIIREEGFRCKGITEKLLALARTSNKSRETVDVPRIAGDVVALVQGLKPFRDRQVRLIAGTASLTVWGNESELKQVLLNLIINALQAVPLGTGQVTVETLRRGGAVELSVADNGRGMDAQTLDRVFEPFFADARPGMERGTGLGLSITHAIVEAHGGRITAESPGPGQGSRFIIQLPAYTLNDGKAA